MALTPLKVKTQIINLVDYAELERFAREVYNLSNYEFAAVEECDNDSDHAFVVSALSPDRLDDDAEDIALIRGGHVPLYRNHLLLDLLCTDNLLAPGNYLISVCW